MFPKAKSRSNVRKGELAFTVIDAADAAVPPRRINTIRQRMNRGNAMTGASGIQRALFIELLHFRCDGVITAFPKPSLNMHHPGQTHVVRIKPIMGRNYSGEVQGIGKILREKKTMQLRGGGDPGRKGAGCPHLVRIGTTAGRYYRFYYASELVPMARWLRMNASRRMLAERACVQDRC